MLNTYLEEKPTLLHVKNRYIIEMYNGCLIEYNKCLEERKLKKMEPKKKRPPNNPMKKHFSKR